jgi:hypothetical protein
MVIRGGAGMAALGLALAACGGGGGSGSTAASSTSPSAAASSPSSGTSPSTSASTTSEAATLRAGLDTLLREHVDLTAFAVQTAVSDGLTSAQTKGALAALSANTDALGAAFGQVYGHAAQEKFLQLWRAHIGFFVTYTEGVASHNAAQIATANRELAGYSSSFAEFVHGATKLPMNAVEADLKGHVQTLEAAIRAIVTKSADAGAKLEMAAMHMDGTAAVLAQGITTSKSLAGNPSSKASDLRSALTGLLIQHVAATEFVVQTAVAAKGDLTNPEVKGAIQALTDNTNQLGDAFGSVYGAGAKTEFLKLWNAHIGFFVHYTLGKATKNQAEVATAQKDLAGYITSFASFVHSATRLPQSAVASDLKGHVQTLEAAINNTVANSPSAGSAAAMAETHMAGTAAVLSAGIVQSKASAFAS